MVSNKAAVDSFLRIVSVVSFAFSCKFLLFLSFLKHLFAFQYCLYLSQNITQRGQ